MPLTQYYQAEAVDYGQTLAESLALGEQIAPMLGDVSEALYSCRDTGKNVLFEGAQGAMLDIDHGTYPYVTSSNTTAGGAACGTGVGLLDFDYVLGITKAYSTRVGNGPFPTELVDGLASTCPARARNLAPPPDGRGVAAGLMRC